MEKKDYFRFYSSDFGELLPEKAGSLYVGNILNESVWWYDNDAREWLKSLFNHKAIASDPEFVLVKEFDNGYITSIDAVNYLLDRGKIILPTSNIDDEMSM